MNIFEKLVQPIYLIIFNKIQSRICISMKIHSLHIIVEINLMGFMLSSTLIQSIGGSCRMYRDRIGKIFRKR